MINYTRDYPTEYAQLFGLGGQARGEPAASFRARIARELSAGGQYVYAHEALYNAQESWNPFAYGPVDDGYGDSHIDEVAKIIQGCIEAAAARQYRRTLPWWPRGFLFVVSWGGASGD